MTRKIMTICPAVQFSFVIRVLTTIGFEVGYQDYSDFSPQERKQMRIKLIICEMNTKINTIEHQTRNKIEQ